MNKQITYLDNAATTWPKPQLVKDAIAGFYDSFTGSQGRAGHGMAHKASQEVFETRELLAGLFNVPESEKIIFTANATHAINYAIKGLIRKGDHVICSGLEHNAVYRPLNFLESQGIIKLTVLPYNKDADFDTDALTNAFVPETRLVITTHASNVNGYILPVKKIGQICRDKGITYVVDAAQTAGFVPIDVQNDNISMLIFSGHKKLYGPTGIGGLCLNRDTDIETLIHGGTGSKSESGVHPSFYPDKLEAGTPNTLGIYGLKAGVNFILGKGIENIRKSQTSLINIFNKKLLEIDEVITYTPFTHENRLPLISINIKKMISSDLAFKLDKEYGIMTRTGLHCAPLAHKSLKTFPMGTVRFSIGVFNTPEDIDYAIESLKTIINKNKQL